MDAFKNKDGSADVDAQERIQLNMKQGMSEADASKQEIMRAAAIKAVNKGEDTKVQGLENEADAVAMVEAYKDTGQLSKLGDKPLMHKSKLREGITTHIEEVEKKRQDSANAGIKVELEKNKMVYAGAAIKTGASVDKSLAAAVTKKATKGNEDYEKHANELFAKSVDSSDIIAMSKEDRKAHGFRATAKAITGVGKKRDSEKLDEIKDSLNAAGAANLTPIELQEKIDAANDSLN
jgi:hypothetical protein